MDLSKFKPTSDVVQIFIKDSNGEMIPKDDKTNMSITLYAYNSAEYKKVMHELANKRLQKAQRTRKLSITSEEIEKDSLERLINITKSWDIIYDGKCPVLNYESLKQIYTELSWIPNQLDEGLEEANSFTRA